MKCNFLICLKHFLGMLVGADQPQLTWNQMMLHHTAKEMSMRFEEHAMCQWSIQRPANCFVETRIIKALEKGAAFGSTTNMSHCRLHHHHHPHHHRHHHHHGYHLQAWDMQDLCWWRFSSLQQQGCIILHLWRKSMLREWKTFKVFSKELLGCPEMHNATPIHMQMHTLPVL